MAYGFLDIAATASVKEAQRENGSADYWAGFHGERTFDRFTENEAAFIARARQLLHRHRFRDRLALYAASRRPEEDLSGAR